MGPSRNYARTRGAFLMGDSTQPSFTSPRLFDSHVNLQTFRTLWRIVREASRSQQGSVTASWHPRAAYSSRLTFRELKLYSRDGSAETRATFAWRSWEFT